MPILLSLDPAALSAASIKAKFMDQNDAGLDGAVFYAFPLQHDDTALKKSCEAGKCAAQTLSQKKIAFDPEVLPIQSGTKVIFANLDKVKHQIYSLSAAKKFELPLYGADALKPEEVPSLLFDKAGEVILGCNIHDRMKAYIFVMDTPYFVLANTGGYILKDLPDGKYLLKVWHPLATSKTNLPEKRIEIGPATGDAEWSAKLAVRKAAKQKSTAGEGPY